MMGLPSSEVTGAICRVPSTPFSQAPWYPLPVHLCRFRVRSVRGGCFLEVPGRSFNPIRRNGFRPSSHTRRLGTINPIPIDYGFRPRLRGRLTLRGLTLRRNPWTFGVRVSRPDCRYSCQHSHFRDLQDGSPLSLHRLTERSATASRSQRSGVGGQDHRFDQLEYRPCNMRAMAWYSARQAVAVAVSTYPKSRQ